MSLRKTDSHMQPASFLAAELPPATCGDATWLRALLPCP